MTPKKNRVWKSSSSILLTALLLWSAQSLADPPTATGGLRYTVVVDKFDNKSGNANIGNEWSTLLTTALQENGHFIVVAQTDMQLNALKEQLRGMSGTTAQGRKTAKRGHMAPAQLLVKGVITSVKEDAANQGGGFGIGRFRINTGRKKTEIRATMQMIDATTGALVAAKNFTGTTQERALSLHETGTDGDNNVQMGQDQNVQGAFQDAIDQAIKWMVSKLPSVAWIGTVVKVAGNDVIINRGSREGVSPGDEFVAGESDVLRDPDTGEILEEVVHERARIRVNDVNTRTSHCSIVKGDAGQIVEGMAVRYSREKR
jgi:curli biogenesis system outer membrane secretion channel CsgG